MFSLNTCLNFEMTRLETNPNYYFLQRKIFFRMIPEKWYYRREIHSKQHDKKAIFFLPLGRILGVNTKTYLVTRDTAKK